MEYKAWGMDRVAVAIRLSRRFVSAYFAHLFINVFYSARSGWRIIMVYVFYTYMNKKIAHSYNGGGNYALNLLKTFAENKKTVNICIPKGYKAVSDIEKELFENPYIKIVEFDDNYEFDYDNPGEIWFPNLSPRSFNLLKKFKQKGFQVYITVHGARNFNLKFDRYDKYYYEGIRYWLFAVCEPVYICTYRFFSKIIMSKYLKYCDKIFTVSNHSLIELTKRFKINYIQLYYQGILQNKEMDGGKLLLNEKYILFVSGNRREKNLLRTLIAFLRYAQEHNTDIKLFVTGIDEKNKKALIRCKKLNKDMLDKYVKLYGYVSNEELKFLYNNCEFLLYTSKNEGFGLPMLEALYSGKRVLAGYGSAIPETVGALARYVNPYDEKSIYEGISSMMLEDKTNLQEQIIKFQSIIEEKVRINDELFIREFKGWN